MTIERLRIGRYRSLYDVTIEPRGFTVLVGPNNSGKTNLVEAIEFLSDAYRYGLEPAVTRKGGIENIAFRRVRRTKSTIEFDLTLTVPALSLEPFYLSDQAAPKSAMYRIRHQFSLGAISQAIEAPFRVYHERLDLDAITTRQDTKILTVIRDEKDLRVDMPLANIPAWARSALFPFDDVAFVDRIRSTLQPTVLLASSGTYNAAIFSLSREVGAARLYQLSPIEARRAGVPTPNPDLDRYGGNLPAFVNQIKKDSADEWRAILEQMRAVIPDLEQIQTSFTPDRRLTLEFKEAGAGRPWTAEEVSDGTIQSLALFAVLLRSTASLVMVEEPETSLHPWVVRQFVDLCRRTSRAHQIVVTTHSPALIGYLDPREITLVWRSKGMTHVQPLTDADAEVLDMWQRGELSSFDILDTGIVRQAVPPAPA
jgi:predicted ATPase